MPNQSYKIVVTGLDTIHSVACVLEFFFPVTMNQITPTTWEGTINNLTVNGSLDYELFITAGGRVSFSYVITNLGNNVDVCSGSDHTNVKIPNGANIRGNCNPE